MKKAVWFSRHTISNEQRAEITARGYQLVAEAEGKTLGSVALRDEEDVRIVLNGLRSLGVDAIFGVFAAPIQAALSVMGQSADDEDMGWMPVFAAWNVNRAAEGERPQFSHRKFVRVGTLTDK